MARSGRDVKRKELRTAADFDQGERRRTEDAEIVVESGVVGCRTSNLTAETRSTQSGGPQPNATADGHG